MIRDPIAPLRPDFQARTRRESPQQDVAPTETTAVTPTHRVQQPRVRKSAHITHSEAAARAPSTRKNGEQGIDVVGDSLPELLNRINVSGAQAAVREEGPSRVQIASLGRSLTDQAALVARLRIREGRLAAPTSAAKEAEAHAALRESTEHAAEQGARRAQLEAKAQEMEARREQLVSAAADAAQLEEMRSTRGAEPDGVLRGDGVLQREGAESTAEVRASAPPGEAVAPPGSLVDVMG